MYLVYCMLSYHLLFPAYMHFKRMQEMIYFILIYFVNLLLFNSKPTYLFNICKVTLQYIKYSNKKILTVFIVLHLHLTGALFDADKGFGLL